MLNQILMTSGVLCVLAGATLLLAPTSKSSDMSILAGAALASLGILLASMSFREWLTWRKYIETNAKENAEPTSHLARPATTEPLAFRPQFRRGPRERRRSQRILVQVAVLLRIQTPDDVNRPTLAFTIWVNAHGGVLESPVRTRAGEAIILVIPQSSKEANCHVLQVQKASEESFAISFEFDQRSPEFWPIASPPPDWDAAPALRS